MPARGFILDPDMPVRIASTIARSAGVFAIPIIPFIGLHAPAPLMPPIPGIGIIVAAGEVWATCVLVCGEVTATTPSASTAARATRFNEVFITAPL